MNERIKELAMSIQCERHWTEEDIEEFGKKIVKETIDAFCNHLDEQQLFLANSPKMYKAIRATEEEFGIFISEKQKLMNRINNYLGNGGLFNPEYMDHEKVRDLLIDLRQHLTEK